MVCVSRSGVPLVCGDRMPAFSSATRISRLLATVVVVLSALGAWTVQLQSHCASHAAAAHDAPAHQSKHPAEAAWMGPAEHDCAHCPPTECSRLAPCAASASVALGASVAPIVALRAHTLHLPDRFDPQPFSAVQPPTPPPQVVS